MKMGLRLPFCAVILFLLGAWAPDASQTRMKVLQPIYNPGTRSYFEMIPAEVARCHCTWAEAFRAAQAMGYKGARGRLAIVSTPQTHQFIGGEFRPEEPTWIGMRYMCRLNKVLLSDGNILSPNGFKVWDRPWNQSGPNACDKSYNTAQFLGVAYSPVASGFRWYAKEAHKYATMFLVEFPTGHP